MGSKRSHSKDGNKSSKQSRAKDSGGSSLSSGGLAIDDLPLRPLCDPWSRQLQLSPSLCRSIQMTLSEEKMEIGFDIVDSDEFNLPPSNYVTELRLHRQEVLPIPIIFSMACGHSIDWDRWIDRKLQDIEFVNLLRWSQIYGSVLVSRGLNMKKDIVGL